MKRTIITIVIMSILSVFMLVSCHKGNKITRQANSIISLSYNQQGMSAYGLSYFVENCRSGAKVTISKNSPKEMV